LKKEAMGVEETGILEAKLAREVKRGDLASNEDNPMIFEGYMQKGKIRGGEAEKTMFESDCKGGRKSRCEPGKRA